MTEERKVGYAYQLSCQFGSETMFQINGNFPVGATVEEMNAEMDKLGAVTTRQQAKAKILVLESQISELEIKSNAAQRDLEDANKRFEGAKSLPVAETQARHNLTVTIRSYQDRIEALKTDLAAVKKAAE